MGRWVLAFFVCIAVVCSGCARNVTPPPPADFVPTFPDTPATEEAGPLGSGVEIPSSHGPLDRNDIAVRRIREVFRSVASQITSHQYFSASQFQAVIGRLRVSPVVVSKCDLQVLKIFVASDWVPIVVIQSPVGPKHIRALVGYDDSTERLVLIDPINYAEMTFGYSEFSDQWTDPQDACLLVFPQRVVLEDTIKRVLIRYLPEEKVESISVRVPKRR